MLLEGEVSFLECQREVEVFVELVAVDRNFDSGHLATAPDVIANFKVISKPGVGHQVLLVNVAETVFECSPDQPPTIAVTLSNQRLSKNPSIASGYGEPNLDGRETVR